MTGGGPFRDTTRPMIADARARLAALRERRAAVEAERAEGRAACAAIAAGRRAERWREFKRGLRVGTLIALVCWVPILVGIVLYHRH